jgi:hypothetical protein
MTDWLQHGGLHDWLGAGAALDAADQGRPFASQQWPGGGSFVGQSCRLRALGGERVQAVGRGECG